MSELMWIPIKEEVVTVDWQGREITLKNVPAEKHQKTNRVRVRLDDIIKAEQEYLVSEHGLEPRNIHQLLLLYAPIRFARSGYIEQKFRFNKMLFCLWKEIEKIGFGDSYIFDEFAGARAGPIPVQLKNDLIELDKKGIIEAIFEKKPGKSSKFQLTKHGEKIAKSLWDNTPDNIKKIILKTKEELFFVDATQLKEKFHQKYPEYKKNYVELDIE